MSGAEQALVLPDHPNEWSIDLGGFRQCWMPGAFGDRESIEDVVGFRVVDDTWGRGEDGLPQRTILRAEIAEFAA